MSDSVYKVIKIPNVCPVQPVSTIYAQTTNLRPVHLVNELNYLCINKLEVWSATVSRGVPRNY